MLDHELVQRARQVEMEFFRQMRVYDKVHKSHAKGKKLITCKRVDTNKGDALRPDYGSRLVWREIKHDSRLDLFAPTPPLEVMKMLITHCADNQNRDQPLRIATIDVRRAYFYAPVEREVYVKLPAEDSLPGESAIVT